MKYFRIVYNAFLQGDYRAQLCAFSLVILYVIYLGYHTWYISAANVPVFQALPFDMPLTGTKLWDDKLAFHEYRADNLKAFQQLPVQGQVCDDFFALWPSDCVDKFSELDEKMRVLSAQMSAMGSNLTLFVTDSKQCDFPYPGISTQTFNATELLVSMGFSVAFPIMDTWKKTRYTRIPAILRIGLAHRHGKSYLDTDVTLLLLQKEPFMRAYAGAALWSNLKNAIEITNAAFCLPRPVLADMMAFQRARVLKGGEDYFYTELGPSMFHNVLMNRYPVALYSQNHPAQPSLDSIARDVHQYGHLQLHLTGHVRKGNSNLAFGEIVNVIRTKIGLPTLTYPAPSPFVDEYRGKK